jgi:D-alanyl-D-alanine carboxypeptidase
MGRRSGFSRTTTRRVRKTTLPRLKGAFLGLGAVAALAVFALLNSALGSPGETDANGAPIASQGDTLGAASAPSAAGKTPPCPYCNQDANRWQALTNVPPPQLGGRAAAVVEGSCGALIYGLHQDERLPPASLTKIATALVVADIGRMSDRVNVRINGWDLAADDGSSIMGLEAGMNLSVEELLYGLLLPSGNDAAIELASHYGGKAHFVALMNQRAAGLGLTNTHFTNTDGRHNPQLYSTPLDMIVLGRELMANSALAGIVGTQQFRPAWDGATLWNGNYLHYIYPGTLGVKTGFTEEANSTIVAAVERGGRLLYASSFGSWDAYWDAIRLFDWAFENTSSACPAGAQAGTPR